MGVGYMSELILLESVSARNEKLAKLTQDASLDHLNKAKSLVMAVWQGSGIATTEQMAEYYEVPIDTVRSIASRHKEEFDEEWFIAAMSFKDKLFDSRKGRDFLALCTKEARLLYLQTTNWTELVEPKKSLVYFILDTGNKLIKIGFSKSVEARLNNLQMGNINALRLLAVCEGARTEENRLHKKFAKHRVRSEWFKDCKEIRDFIATLLPYCENPLSDQDIVWTPRAALRLAMMLPDSVIARQIRDLPLDLSPTNTEDRDKTREVELQLEFEKLRIQRLELISSMVERHGMDAVISLLGYKEVSDA
jgi:hypothetical protein